MVFGDGPSFENVGKKCIFFMNDLLVIYFILQLPVLTGHGRTKGATR